MCYNTAIQQPLESVKRRWPNIIIKNGEVVQGGLFNGFAHPFTPIICKDEPEVIQTASWGLLPSWAKDKIEFRKRTNTLNARIETIHERASYKASVNNRCLIIVDQFFEHQWQDEDGKVKKKFKLYLPNDELFTLAGLYNDWTDRISGESFRTYTVLMTEANKLMAEIHNSKKRMPVMPSAQHEMDWLRGGELIMQNDRLEAAPVL